MYVILLAPSWASKHLNAQGIFHLMNDFPDSVIKCHPVNTACSSIWKVSGENACLGYSSKREPEVKGWRGLYHFSSYPTWASNQMTKSFSCTDSAPVSSVVPQNPKGVCASVQYASCLGGGRYYHFWSYHFMGNRWGNSGNSVRLYFLGLQNHYRWWLQPWN